MRFERDDAKVGVLVLVALALFLSLAVHRTLREALHREVVHKVRLRSVADLPVGSEVQLGGLRVGQVTSIELERHGVEYELAATLGLRPDIVLWRGTKGVVTSRIMGQSVLDLRLPPLAERTAELPPGEMMDGETGASLASVTSDLSELAGNLDRGVSELRQELSSRGLASLLEHPSVEHALEEFSTTFVDLREASKTAQATLEHGDRTLTELDRRLATLDQALTTMQGFLARSEPEVHQTLASVEKSAQEVEALSAEARALLATAGPGLDDNLRALRRTLDSTQELLELLKAKPSRVLLGTPTEADLAAARARVEEARKNEEPTPPPK